MYKMPFYRHLLHRELAARKAVNPRFSLRGFSSLLAIDPGDLSKIMRGKKAMSTAAAHKACECLQVSPKERVIFLASVAEYGPRAQTNVDATAMDIPESKDLDQDIFRVISDLYHYAIMEMTMLNSGLSNAREASRYLGITVIEAETAIARLQRLGLIAVDGEGRIVKRDRSITTRDKSITTPAHRGHQKQVLRGALRALQETPLDERSITSMTMAIAPQKIPTAKHIIQEFMESLCSYLEDGDRSDLYQLGVSLYPLKGSFKS